MNAQCTMVRIFNAACFLPAVRVCVGSRELAGMIPYGEASLYYRITSGFRRVSVIDVRSGEELWSGTMPFSPAGKMTLIICNTMHNISVLVTEENGSLTGRGKSGIRLGNFSFDEGPFRLILKDGTKVFEAVCPHELTCVCPANCGEYELVLQRMEKSYTQEDTAMEKKVRLMPEKNYTLCVIGADSAENPLQMVMLEY